ncbi:MAG: histidine kinase [Verrucomicrobia bacterium]|nr:histidine kinase [Verrucomicrobiota bacterium]
MHEQPEAADRVVIRLSELLRASLERPDTHEIPLGQELGFLHRYLEIEQARFGERLSVEFHVPVELEDVLVPALLLQPIVENAIRHGIEEREEAGCIQVAAARVEGCLELQVVDNGPGLPPGRTGFVREGIGLSNTRSRLRHLYGDCQSLDLSAAPGGGLCVRIRLPCRTAQDPVPSPGHPAVIVGCNPSAATA